MSIVGPELPGARVLDLFAGSGALGLEALSRGAVHADFVEKDPRSLRVLRENTEHLNAGSAARIVPQDAFEFLDTLSPGAYDIVFADPPYSLGLAERVADHWRAHQFARLIGIEHEATAILPPGARMRRYGDTAISLYHLPT